MCVDVSGWWRVPHLEFCRRAVRGWKATGSEGEVRDRRPRQRHADRVRVVCVGQAGGSTGDDSVEAVESVQPVSHTRHPVRAAQRPPLLGAPSRSRRVCLDVHATHTRSRRKHTGTINTNAVEEGGALPRCARRTCACPAPRRPAKSGRPPGALERIPPRATAGRIRSDRHRRRRPRRRRLLRALSRCSPGGRRTSSSS